MERFDRSAVLRVVFVVALAGMLLLPTVSARPPPQAVCGVCSDTLVDAAAENGVAIGRAESSLSIGIDRAGTGHWTARVTLTGPGIETLQGNQSLRDRVVQRVYERGYVAIAEPKSLTTSMHEKTLVVEYEVPGMAHESVGGVYVVDFFYWHGGQARWFSLAADTLTMRGPPGTVVSHIPTDATTDGRTVTWERGDSDPLGRSHVVFAPDDGVSSGVATTLGRGADVAGLKARDLGAAVAPVGLFVAVLALLWRFGSRLTELSRSQLVALVAGPLAAVGLAAAAVETLGGVSGRVTQQLGEFLFYLLFVVVGTGAGPALVLGGPLVVGQILVTRRLLGETSRTREAVTRLLLWPTAAVLAGQWLLVPVAAAGAAGYDTTYGLVSLVVPPLYFLPLAVTRQWGLSLRVAFATGLLVSPIPVVLALAPQTGLGLVIRSRALAYAPWGLVVAAIGILAYAAGDRLVATGHEPIESHRPRK